VTELHARLRAAFQAEHKEYLQGIRALLTKLEADSAAVSAAELDEVYRQAHSLRAAARVCDFTTVEAIGQRLETLFTRLRKGELRPGRGMIDAVRTVLGAVEAWARGLEEGNPPAEPGFTLTELDRLLSGSAAKPAVTLPDALAPKLLAAFQIEHKEHLEGIRSFLAEIEESGTVAGPRIDEAFRRAHSLKGAARLAELPAAEKLAHRLENLFAQVREGTRQLDPPILRAIHLGLDSIEDVAACLAEQRRPPEAGDALAAIDQALAGEAPLAAVPVPAPASAAPTLPAADTVRVSTEHLDRLLRSTGQLLTENLRQNVVARELAGLRRGLDELEKDWESLRNRGAAALAALAATPALARVARYLGTVEHKVRVLSRQARALGLLQRRSTWALGQLGAQLQQDVRRVRTVPAESVLQGFRKMMRDLARDEGKEIDFRVSGLEIEGDRLVLQVLKDPLMHILCNAVSHGIESPDERQRQGKDPVGRVTLHLETQGNRLHIVVEDDGRGIDVRQVSETAVRRGLLSRAEAAATPPDELARLVFRPGFSTAHTVTGLAGRGMGLSVVQEAAARLQGEVSWQARDGPGTRLVLSVPLSIATQRLLLVSCRGQMFALPVHAIERLLRIKQAEVESVEGRPMVLVRGQPIPLLSLAQLLKLDQAEVSVTDGYLPLILLRSGPRRVAVAVDALLAERDSVIKELDAPARHVRTLAGGILLEDGAVALVLNPAELLSAPQPAERAPVLKTVAAGPPKKTATVLVVDDSLTTRTLEKSLLEAHGYDVRIAMDGVEALAQLREELPDLVITDIQMPRMDGFRLLEEIKKEPRLARLPVIVVTSMETREDQERGLALGADAYIVKKKFDHQELLETIRQII
jgi:two-component system chemotaxis sensor kinase CheA